jgi:hypothetical protein
LGSWTARLEEVAEKLVVGHKMRPLGLKPALILEALRGAEAPLFHRAARIRGFFRAS